MIKDTLVEELRNSLPPIVTKEQLMNHYIYKMEADREITVFGLIYAAGKAGIKVHGHSKLQINISREKQIDYYLKKKSSPDRSSLSKRIYANGPAIVAAYEGGVRSADLADMYNCANQTMNYYLRRLGAKMRRKGALKSSDKNEERRE